MINTLYPLFKYNFLSNKIIKEYPNDRKYIQNNYIKNDYLTIKYFNKSYIPYNSIENKNILTTKTEKKPKTNIKIIRKNSIKNRIYEYISDSEEENKEINVQENKTVKKNIVNTITISITIVISLMIIKCNLFN